MPGRWSPLAHQPPFRASTMLLLTDGSVMVQESGGKCWWRLTPDRCGDYLNGSWSPLAPMADSRLYFASAVLADGRVIVAGGEISSAGDDTNKVEIYDPLANAWTPVASPPGWPWIGDAPCCVLPDGRLLLGSITSDDTAIYDPVCNAWAQAGSKNDLSAEETWTLLPDGSVLTVDCSTATSHAERYLPEGDVWIPVAAPPPQLVSSSGEIGPAILLPDGRVFATGATGLTGLFAPPGGWTEGPRFPDSSVTGARLQAQDSPACLLPNGNVLCCAGPPGEYPPPTSFFEFEGEALVPVPAPDNAGLAPFHGRMLLLPSGEVLFANGTRYIAAYLSEGAPDAASRPMITGAPGLLTAGSTYELQGRQLNGRSQAVSYGDDASMATNYPLVRLVCARTGDVFYCRTAHHSTMAVATGACIQSTRFTVPWSVPPGEYELYVVANGIPSKDARPVEVAPFEWEATLAVELIRRLARSLAEAQEPRVLGPTGLMPVDTSAASGGEITGDARAAVRGLVAGVEALEALGRAAHEERMKAAQGARELTEEEILVSTPPPKK